MKIKDLQILIESKNTPVVVVDVQPAYYPVIQNSRLDVSRLMEFLNQQQGPILMLINADETGITEDTKNSCIEFWVEHGLLEDTLNRIRIFDKGYGYFRAWMDNGISPSTVIRVVRALYQHKVNDSRDLDLTRLKEIVGNEWKEWMEDDPITVEWLSVSLLKQFNNCYICGGGEEECLAEVQLLMNAFNIKYKTMKNFIY